ncbi:MAG: nuclear transport factor 2 family protein [Segetibacter sp.]
MVLNINTMHRRKLSITNLDYEIAIIFAKEFEQTFNSGDYQSMASYYAEDGKLIGNKITVANGREAIEQFWKQTCKRASKLNIKRTIIIEDVISSNGLGYISGTVKVKIIFYL